MSITVEAYTGGNEAAKRLEYEIYLEEGFIEANEYGVVLENEDYPDFIHFVASENGVPVGSLRLVTDPQPRHEGIFRLASFTHFGIEDWARELLARADLASVVEVGTMVIRPGHRGGKAYAALFSKALEFCIMSGLRYAVSTVDAGFHDRLARRGIPMRHMGEPEFYMGSETIPVMVDIRELAQRVVAEQAAAGASAENERAMAS